MPAQCVFTVDVEDWFHILDLPTTPPLEQWGHLESHVEVNVHRLLEIFAAHNVAAVFFFLGWVAERFPKLVESVATAGHEVASHGYAHRLIYQMTREEFSEDTRRAKQVLEEITGNPVPGFRATGFSVTDSVEWFFDEIAAAGHTYDSSVFPASRGHGGMSSGQLAPYIVATQGGDVTEFPITVTEFMGKRLCLFGGGYLRFFPLRMILSAADRVLTEGRPVVFYIHPREIEPGHPRLPMPLSRRFKSYVGLNSVRRKLDAILARYEFTTFSSLIRNASVERSTND